MWARCLAAAGSCFLVLQCLPVIAYADPVEQAPRPEPSAEGADERVATCVVLRGAPTRPGLKRLIESELDRHRTHRVSTKPCDSILLVELIVVGGDAEYLTGRINQQVPYRERVGPEGLGVAVSRLLRVVLHNDPVVLRGPRSVGWFERRVQALRQHSELQFSCWILEVGYRLHDSIGFLPGLGVALRREVDDFTLGAHVMGALEPNADEPRLRLTTLLGGSLELGYYLTPGASTSPFVSLTVGLAHQRYRGPSALADNAGEMVVASATGATLGTRLGVEMFRVTDVRALVFVEAAAPLFISRDEDEGSVEAWVPWASLGAGLAF